MRRVTLSVAALALVLIGVGAAVALGGLSGGGQLLTIADEPPTLSIDDVTAGETNFDTDAVLTIALSGPSTKTVTVHWATADGTAELIADDQGPQDSPPQRRIRIG